jgi:biopolymer transport protein ExbB/TolQ
VRRAHSRRSSPSRCRAADIDEALTLTETHKDSHVARVLGESLREVAPLLEDPRLAAAAITSAERSVEREQILLADELKSGLGVLATIGATAPFVGLLGTTMGIVNSFTGMAVSGGGGLEAISAGIAEALIATALGLHRRHPRRLALQLLHDPPRDAVRGARLRRPRDGRLDDEA